MKIKNIILFLSLNLLFNCTYYNLKDSSEFNLSPQEKAKLNSKKIELFGFDLLLESVNNIPEDIFLNLENKIKNPDHLKIIRFVNTKDNEVLPEHKNSFKQFRAFKMSSKPIYLFDKYIEVESNTKKYFDYEYLIQNEVITKKVSELKLKEFLSKYLGMYKHLGLESLSTVIEIKKIGSIQLKKTNKDYYIIGIHEKKGEEDNFGTIILTVYTLGILPVIKFIETNSTFIVFDSDLNIIGNYSKQNTYTKFTGLFVPTFELEETATKKFNSKALQYDVKEFTKQFVNEIK